MSWDYHVAGDAWPSIKQLDAEVQECVFDELEELCLTADDRRLSGRVIERIYPVVDGTMHPLALILLANPQRRLLNLLDIES